MYINRRSRLQAFLVGLVGFCLGTGAGFLSTLLLFKTGVLRALLNLFPDDQPLVKIIAALVLAFVGAGLGGAVNGAFRGYSLALIDPSGRRRRYLLGGSFAQGISQGLLLIPVLLLIALVGKYNPGSTKDPKSFLILFGLLGAVFGLLSGLILSLITLRWRYFWLSWLGSILGGILGGALLGLVLWRRELFLSQSTPLLQLLVLFLVLMLVFGLTGGLLALVYQWIAAQRERRPQVIFEPGRWQDIIVVTVGVLLFAAVINLTQTMLNFVTIHTGSETTSLGLDTQGVWWDDLSPITANIVQSDGETLGLDAAPDGALAAAWTIDQEGVTDVVYAYQRGADPSGVFSWSDWVNVSNSPDSASDQPQISIDSSGAAHLVWTETTGEESQIVYSRCTTGSCSTPVALSDFGSTSCGEGGGLPQNIYPALSVERGTILVAWNADGALAYQTWNAEASLPSALPVCIQPAGGNHPALQPRLAASGEVFSLIYSSGDAASPAGIYLVQITNGIAGEAIEQGQGSHAEISADRRGLIQTAWCNLDGALEFISASEPSEKLSFPPCLSRPGILQDSAGITHLIWYSNQVRNNFNETLPDNLIYESLRTDSGWTEPALIQQLAASPSLAIADQPDGILSMIWRGEAEDASVLHFSRQRPYQCDPANLTPIGQVILNVLTSGEFHPAGYASPYCHNQYQGFIYMPNPEDDFSAEAPTPNGGYDRLAALVQDAHYELLLSNMQWDAMQDEFSPGYRIIEGVSNLYRKVKANPEAYPRGMTVRILLGNYPNLATFTYGDQIWNVIDSLRAAGIEMEDPEVGWKVEVANFSGSYPHSHTKFLIIDGAAMLSAGFNIAWFHLPADHPSGQGDSLTDLGMLIRGPVAQAALSAYDDEWNGANQLVCSDLGIGTDSERWKKSCQWQIAQVSHPPEVLKFYLAEENQNAFALYRTDVYKEADNAYIAALSSASRSIDAMHVNFSADLICWLELVAPGYCSFEENALPWMKAMAEAIASDHVHIRVIVENANSNGIENRIGYQILMGELERNGLSEYLELRYFDGRLHTKSALIDQQLLIVGSQNLHYSSFGEAGLLEFGAATESPQAIQDYQEMFDYYWERAVPAEDAVWGAAGSE